MRRLLCILLYGIIVIKLMAQPEPYPIDKSFTPELHFLQKQWYGEYNGVDPMSQSRISIKRTLCLSDDMKFTNQSYGIISTRNGVSNEMLLKSEKGTYRYDDSSNEIIYVIEADTALDMSVFLKNNTDDYIINEYTPNSVNNTYSEPTQFTYLENDERKWVVQDSKLGSDQQQGKPAVYVMTGSTLSPTSISIIAGETPLKDDKIYDLRGNRLINIPKRTIYIRGGKKFKKE